MAGAGTPGREGTPMPTIVPDVAGALRADGQRVHVILVGDQDRFAGSAAQAAGVWLRARIQIWSSGLLAC